MTAHRIAVATTHPRCADTPQCLPPGTIEDLRALDAGLTGLADRVAARRTPADCARAIASLEQLSRRLTAVLERLDPTPQTSKPGMLAEVSLTPREREILGWIASGKSNAVIADILGISRHTVDTYNRRIFRKLDAGDRTTAAIKAMSIGLVPGR